MTSEKVLAKKCEAVKKIYFDASDNQDSYEDLPADDIPLFESMERFHKLSHTR